MKLKFLPLKRGSTFFLGSNFVHRFVHWSVSKIYGKKMFVMPVNRSVVSGAAVFWYFENGTRIFMMLGKKKAHFASFKELPKDETASEMIQTVAETSFGSTFMKSIGPNTLAEDSVAAAPTFTATDNEVNEKISIQTLVWVSQITPQQAALVSAQDNSQILFLEETQFLSPDVDPVHRAIYQAALRHIHQKNWHAAPEISELLKEGLSMREPPRKTIH